MKKTLRQTLLAGVVALLIILGGQMLYAQNEAAPPPPAGPGAPQAGGPGGPGGMRRQFDPARMEERLLGRVQEELKATDEEWTAIKPLLSDVFKAQMKARPNMRGMMRRPGGQGGPGAPGRQGGMMGAGNPEAEALQTAAENDSTSNAELKDKLKAYRAAVKKNQDELKAAREKLRKVLSLRQEAKLVAMGILD